MSLMQEMNERALELGVPLGIHLDVTYRCNERCVHCYLDHDDHGEMSTVEIKDILQQLAEACVRSSRNDGNGLDDDRIDGTAALALQPVRHGEHEANRTSPLLRQKDDGRLDVFEDRTVFLEERGVLERLEQKAPAKARDRHRVDSTELFVDA